MGTFLTNVHVQCSSPEQVTEVVRSMDVQGAWLSGPNGPWITLWDSMGLTRAGDLAQHVSKQLEAPAIAFMVHDSDILFYWLYDNGQLLDEYNSCPGYFDGDDSMEEAYQADCEQIKKYCRAETTIEELERLLKIWTQAEALEGVMPEFVFVEQRLAELAKHLEIPTAVVNTDYGEIGRDVHPDEIGARWIGEGNPSDHPGMMDMAAGMEGGEEVDFESGAAFVSFPASPLHTAALSDNLAEIVKYVEEGNDIDETNEVYSTTALSIAAASASVETLRKMIELGADVNASNNVVGTPSPLRSAIIAGKLENVRELLAHGATVEDIDPNHGTLLHSAAMRGSVEAAKLLIDRGVDPKSTNTQGQTPRELAKAHRESLNQAVQTFGQGSLPKEMQDLLEGMQQIEDYLAEFET